MQLLSSIMVTSNNLTSLFTHSLALSKVKALFITPQPYNYTAKLIDLL